MRGTSYRNPAEPCCPHCNQPLPRGIQTYSTKRRPGGRQVSYQRGVRVLAGWLYDNGYARSEASAARTAARVLRGALPAKQRAPRQQSRITEAA